MNLIKYIFPRQCLICLKIGEDICDSCLKKQVHTLPSCYICKRLNNGYLTHTGCYKVPIQYFTGWFLTKELELNLKRKEEFQLFSIYGYLMSKLIIYHNLEKVLQESRVFPMRSSNKEHYNLNRFLSNRLPNLNKNGKDILFVSSYTEDIQTELDRTKGLCVTEPFNVRFLVLFNPILN